MLGLSVANVVGVPGGDLARPARSAGARPTGRSAVLGAASPSRWSLAFVPVAARATRTPPAAASCARSPSRRCWLTLLAGRDRLRRHVRRLLLHRADASPRSAACPSGAVPVFLLAFGLGMVAGTWLAGELADWSVFRSLLIGSRSGMAAVLAALRASLAPYGWCVAARWSS